jgi:CBS domain containing-hemolysin-like protein
VRRLAPNVYEVPAGEHVSEVNEELDIELPEEEDYETLAGFVLAKLGRFPDVGESFESDGVQFQVTEATDRRVLSVRVQLPEDPGSDPASPEAAGTTGA